MIRSKLYIGGGIVTIIWILFTLYLSVTAEEMEILAAFIVLLVGGYILGIYFLLVGTLTAKTKKAKWIVGIFFILWLLIPLWNHLFDEIQSSWYQNKLAKTTPTEEVITEIFSRYDGGYVQLPTDFYAYQNQELTIKIDTLENEFIPQARKTYEDLITELGHENESHVDELMIEDVFYQYLFSVMNLHHDIWNITTAPKKITIELYYNDELIFKSSSTDYHTILEQEDLMGKMKLFYEKLKPDIIGTE